jgi:hypothetical protein
MAPSTLLNSLQAATALAAGLTVYMAWLALCGLAPMVFDTRVEAYYWLWIFCQPIQWALDILVVLERHPGLVMLGCWGISVKLRRR